MKMKSIPIDNRPRERFDKFGARALSDYEIIAIMIGSGNKDNSVLEIAKEILNEINIHSLDEISINELKKIKGIGHITAMKIMASIELARRVRMKSIRSSIKSSIDVFNLLNEELYSYREEHFIAIYLDAKCSIISKKTIFIGTATMTITHPREVFKYAVKESAVGIIMVHNHPSGNPTPSKGDIDFTKKIYRLGCEMEIHLLDHIIIAKNNYYSLKDHKDF